MTRGWMLAFAMLFLTACGSKESSRCAQSAECPAGAACTDGACVAATCTVDSDCDLGSVCGDGACVAGCRAGLDCPPATPICVGGGGGVGTCAACSGDADCPAGDSCVEQQCRQPCRDDSNCRTGHCDPASRWCVDCTDDAHCAAGNVCVDQACVAGCDDDTTCPIDRPRCVAERGNHGACVECRGSADCAVGTCRGDGTCGVAEPIDAGPDVGVPDGGPIGGDPDAGPIGGNPDAGPPASRFALDVLVVMDTTGSMELVQNDFVAAFPAFITELERVAGRRPDLHLGVITADLGTGSGVFSQCPGTGDNGALQHEAVGAGCVAPSGAFLRDVAGPAGREVNYTGNLGSAFACIADIGPTGCTFEQPLAALTRALDGSIAGNAGFLRPGAALAVIIVGDEDDCSASTNSLFDLFNTGLGDLGLRCFEQGVRCEPDAARTPGTKLGCVPRPASAYLPTSAHYAEQLRLRVPDGRIAVAVIGGPSQPVTVADSSGVAAMQPSCTDGAAARRTGYPGIRLAAFASAFGARGTMSSVCGDLAAPLRTFAGTAAAMLH